MRWPLLLTMLLTGCSSAGGPYPSLQPRAAETIDPRLQPPAPINDRPVKPALAAQLSALLGQARAGEAAFEPAVADAERLAAAAGAPHSEGWIAAQQALSAAIAARKATALAAADVDALGATMLQAQGGLAPADLAAIESAGAEIGTLSRRQAQRIDAIQALLAR